MQRLLRTLLLEDQSDDAELLLHELRRGGYEPEWVRVWTAHDFAQALAEDWDVILADFSMPRFSAPAALEILKQSGLDIPFIIVSGSVSEQNAVESMKAGAQDFLAKSNLQRLNTAVSREVQEAKLRANARAAAVRLRETEELHRQLVLNVKEYALLMLDARGYVKSWNPGVERLTGHSEGEIVGRHFSLFFEESARSAGAPEECLSSAMELASHVSEGPRVRKDGSVFWSECTTGAIRDGGNLIGFSHILRDVTDRKRLLDGLKQAITARDEFLSIASHELRTPLTSLQVQLDAYARLTKNEPMMAVSHPKVLGKVRSLTRQAERLTTLIIHLLEVTRLTSGRKDMHRARLDLEEVVNHVLKGFGDVAERAHSEVQTSLRSVVGEWDRLRIELVVSNLLSNAFKYGRGRPVKVTLDGSPDVAVLTVSDQGIGISPDEQARIFERFERAVPETHYGGFGLGLWIVRQVVEAHGGEIKVLSKKGEGSSFTIELPRYAKDQSRASAHAHALELQHPLDEEAR